MSKGSLQELNKPANEMDLILEILDWAKNKKDLGEIYYENKAASAPVCVHMIFDGTAPKAPLPAKTLAPLKAPAIGKLSLSTGAVKPGAAVRKEDALGYIEGTGEKTPIIAPFSGTILEVMAQNNAHVGYGDPILLLELP